MRSNNESPSASRYEILTLDDKRHYSILVRRGDILEVLMHDVGVMDNAKFILKKLIERDQERLISTRQRDTEFLASLNDPHAYIRMSVGTDMCYCGEIEDDPRHTKDEDC